jgi:hypothetical protein
VCHHWHTLHAKLYNKHHQICIKRSGSCCGLQAHHSSSKDATGQSGSQSEVEELNERLFELRVELQNLADDTTISVASIKRKVCPEFQENYHLRGTIGIIGKSECIMPFLAHCRNVIDPRLDFDSLTSG